MTGERRFLNVIVFSLAAAFALAGPVHAQSSDSTVYHQIEGRLRFKGEERAGVRVRLLQVNGLRPVAETFSRASGEFVFTYITEGAYIVETLETERLEATSTTLSVRPLIKDKPSIFYIMIEIPPKVAAKPKTEAAPGVVAANVDLDVPKPALKHYLAGEKALQEGKAETAIKELQQAIQLYPNYYAARLTLGRELRIQKNFDESAEALKPLSEIAPRVAEGHVEYAITLFLLRRLEDAVKELKAALEIEETNWQAHLYLGWTLLDSQSDIAETHLKRAIELNEKKSVRAHLALARLANAKGQRQAAIQHLEAYLAIAPDAPDAEATRKLVARLRAEK